MNNFGYPSLEPCQVCGKHLNNQSEPRFGYVVCQNHQGVAPVDIPEKRIKLLDDLDDVTSYQVFHFLNKKLNAFVDDFSVKEGWCTLDDIIQQETKLSIFREQFNDLREDFTPEELDAFELWLTHFEGGCTSARDCLLQSTMRALEKKVN